MPGFNINTVTLSGNHTRDPEARTTSGGTDLCKCRIAFNERRKNQSTGEWEDKPNYINVTIFGGMGTWVANNQGKGDSIVISGRLSWHEWETDGNKREAIEIIADSVATPRESRGPSGDSDVPIDTSDLHVPAASPVGAGDDDIPF
jgi:single-strand DNA-binding protein